MPDLIPDPAYTEHIEKWAARTHAYADEARRIAQAMVAEINNKEAAGSLYPRTERTFTGSDHRGELIARALEVEFNADEYRERRVWVAFEDNYDGHSRAHAYRVEAYRLPKMEVR